MPQGEDEMKATDIAQLVLFCILIGVISFGAYHIWNETYYEGRKPRDRIVEVDKEHYSYVLMDGHQYIIYGRAANAVAMAHSPRCKCLK